MYREVPDALHIAVTLACTVQRARQLLVMEEGLLAWLAAKAAFVPQIGAEYRLELDGGNVVEGRIQGYDPSSGIAYSFADDAVRRAFGTTVVHWSWEPLSADYSLVTLTHTGHLQGEAWQWAFELHIKTWTFYLANLVSVVNQGRDQRPAARRV